MSDPNKEGGSKSYEEILQEIRDLRDDIEQTREAATERWGNTDYDESVTKTVEESS